ncbi:MULTISPECIES: acyltransferase family protein [unclassified Microbacterium]|uniref:acyltransferase family protein n=1 Tax=unclassified Microbacterium TaxID=2609290 RepID=UPI003019A77D
MTPTPAPRFAGLDGLRAVAVLLVVLCHLFPGGFLHSGFVGVDVFFVISGFLITALLLRERASTGRIALRAFWVRRARRLVPALVAMVVTCASIAWLIGGDLLLGLGRQVLGAMTFSYNWLSISAGASYFTASRPELFRNLWSLAVEEQFYVLWPLLLPLLLLVRGRALRVAIAVAAAAASALWALAQAAGPVVDATGALAGDPTRAYYGTDTHAFGLLLGVALAFALSGRIGAPVTDGLAGPAGAAGPVTRPIRAGLLAGAGVAAGAGLVVVASWPSGAGAFPLVSVLASICTVVLIAVAVRPGSALGPGLDIAPLRWIGERSYAIYLWHWPLVVLLTTALTGRFAEAAIPVPIGLTAFVATLLAATVSYRLVEQPVRRLGFGGALRALRARFASSPVSRLRALTAIAAVAVLVGGTGAAVTATPRMSSSEAVVQAGADALARAAASTAGTTPAPLATATPSVSPTEPSDDPAARPRPPAPSTVSGERISAVGDSVMLASAEGLLTARPGIQIDAAVSRSMWAGGDIVQTLAAQGALREYVVVGLGTNGPVEDDELQTVYDAIGPDRHLVLVNAFAPRDWIPGVNATLASFATSHPRVVVADWAQAIAPHLDLLAGDEIHPGPTGGALYAETVTAAVDTIENQQTQARYQVDLIRWETLRAFDRLPTGG